MKHFHESHINDLLHTGTPWKVNFSQIYYMNITRLAILAALNGINLDFKFTEQFNCLHAMGYDLNYVMLKISNLINRIAIKVVSIEEDSSKLNIGQYIEFSNKFRTKNVPYPDLVEKNKFKMRGTLQYDPHLYLKKQNCRFIFTLDPRWMATSTSFVNLNIGVDLV